MSLTNILLLFGGRSTEHEISCRSAAFVLFNLKPEKYRVQAVYITKEGKWIPQNLDQLRPPNGATPLQPQGGPSVDPMVLLQQDRGQVVVPVLHGSFGEDGTLQGLLEFSEVAFVGVDTLGSAIGMDKVVSKVLAASAGVPIVPYVSFRSFQWQSVSEQLIAECEKKLSYPMFVKPARLGSTVGISKARDRQQLIAACHDALRYDDKILVEKGLNVRELECAALGGYAPEISVVGEIVMQTSEFYDYTAKYESENSAQVVVPAQISQELSEQIRSYALRVFQVLELYGMSRIDMFLDRDDGKLYFNEVNTIPGFTSISQYPMLWNASGVNSEQLVDRLVALAVERHRVKSTLLRSK